MKCIILILALVLVPTIPAYAAGSFSQSGGNVTIVFEYTTTTAKMLDIVSKAAEQLYNQGEGDQTKPFADYTNQQKVNLIDAHIKQSVQNLARVFSMQIVLDGLRADIAALQQQTIDTENAYAEDNLTIP